LVQLGRGFHVSIRLGYATAQPADVCRRTVGKLNGPRFAWRKRIRKELDPLSLRKVSTRLLPDWFSETTIWIYMVHVDRSLQLVQVSKLWPIRHVWVNPNERCQGTLDGPPRAYGLGESAFGRSKCWGMDDEVGVFENGVHPQKAIILGIIMDNYG